MALMLGISPRWGLHRCCCFTVPASPLAQPWNVVVGNTLAACMGVTAALLMTEPNLALAVAVSLAIILMF